MSAASSPPSGVAAEEAAPRTDSRQFALFKLSLMRNRNTKTGPIDSEEVYTDGPTSSDRAKSVYRNDSDGLESVDEELSAVEAIKAKGIRRRLQQLRESYAYEDILASATEQRKKEMLHGANKHKGLFTQATMDSVDLGSEHGFDEFLDPKSEKLSKARIELFCRIYEEITDQHLRQQTLDERIEIAKEHARQNMRSPKVRQEMMQDAILRGRTMKQQAEIEEQKEVEDERKKHERDLTIPGVVVSDIDRAFKTRGVNLAPDEVKRIFKRLAGTNHVGARDRTFPRLRHFFNRNADVIGRTLDDREVEWVQQVLDTENQLGMSTAKAVRRVNAFNRKAAARGSALGPVVNGDILWILAAKDWIETNKISRSDFVAALDALEICAIDTNDANRAKAAFAAGQDTADRFTHAYDFATPIIDRVILEERRLQGNMRLPNMVLETAACDDCTPSSTYYRRRKKHLRQLDMYSCSCDF